MAKDNWKELQEKAKQNESLHVKERLWTNRIVHWLLLAMLIIILGSAIGATTYVKKALGPADATNAETIRVEIPIGSTADDISRILADAGLVSQRDIFNYYLKWTNDTELQAGYYEFSKAMDADQLIEVLQKGGEPIFVDADTNITVIEGTTLADIAKVVGEQTAISEEEFLETVDSPEFIESLQKQFPSLFESMPELDTMEHPLEGYLFPATYEYFAGMSATELITEMVKASNATYQRLVDDMPNTYLTYHQILTLASIIENEAITEEDRGLVSGVFYNRMAIDMPIQSDVTVLYALGEHKEFVTYDDIETESPYNTYTNTGLPPGPVSNAALTAITAAIYPTWNEYYYFVADIDTQEIYYSATLEEHELLVEEHVNARQASIEADEAPNVQETADDEEVADEGVPEAGDAEEVAQ